MSGVPIKAVSLVPSSTGTGKLPRGSKSVAILDWLVGARGDVSGSSSMAASSSSCGVTVSHRQSPSVICQSPSVTCQSQWDYGVREGVGKNAHHI